MPRSVPDSCRDDLGSAACLSFRHRHQDAATILRGRRLDHTIELSVEKGNTTAAANQLNAFINQVEAFVAAGILTAEEGDALIATAKTILESLA